MRIAKKNPFNKGFIKAECHQEFLRVASFFPQEKINQSIF